MSVRPLDLDDPHDLVLRVDQRESAAALIPSSAAVLLLALRSLVASCMTSGQACLMVQIVAEGCWSSRR